MQGRLVRVAAQAQEAAPERTEKFGAGRWWFLVPAEGRKRFANASCNNAGRWWFLVRAEGRSRSADEV